MRAKIIALVLAMVLAPLAPLPALALHDGSFHTYGQEGDRPGQRSLREWQERERSRQDLELQRRLKDLEDRRDRQKGYSYPRVCLYPSICK